MPFTEWKHTERNRQRDRKKYVMFSSFLVALLNNVAIANIVQNGDFDNGEISPWSCKQVQCEVSQNFLSLTERSQQWAGPRQILNNTNFVKGGLISIFFHLVHFLKKKVSNHYPQLFNLK